MRADSVPAEHPDPDAPPDEGIRAVKLRMLDGFRVVADQQVLSIPLSARRVVAFVALRGRSSRAEVAGTLWPEVQDEYRRLRARPTLIAAALAALGIGGGVLLRRRRKR